MYVRNTVWLRLCKTSTTTIERDVTRSSVGWFVRLSDKNSAMKTPGNAESSANIQQVIVCVSYQRIL